jgi:TAT (twin-arginine translocation) pathway signal sequence
MSEERNTRLPAASDPQSSISHLTRRQFLVLAGSASAAALLAACAPAAGPAPAGS